MDLVISNEKYSIKVGKEVYKIEYPSFKEAQEIAKEFNAADGDSEKSLTLMIDWLKKLGLDEKFFNLKVIKAKHILTIWGDLNSVKK